MTTTTTPTARTMTPTPAQQAAHIAAHQAARRTAAAAIAAKIQARRPRGAWARAVQAYALELLEEVEDHAAPITAAALLNGAENWHQYSYGGCALIYDADIAGRVCSPSVLRRKRGGELPPNNRETWLDCQARALRQAARLIIHNF